MLLNNSVLNILPVGVLVVGAGVVVSGKQEENNNISKFPFISACRKTYLTLPRLSPVCWNAPMIIKMSLSA